VANDKLGVLETMSALLRGRTEPKGVDSKSANSSSVINNEENRVKSNLTSDEQSRLRKIAKIFGEEFGKIVEIGKYAQDTVAKRVSTITPIRALGSMKDRVVSAVSNIKDNKGDFVKTMLGALGAAALGVFGWSLLPKELKEKIKGVVGGLIDSVMTTFKNLDWKTILKIGVVVGGTILTIYMLNKGVKGLGWNLIKLAAGIGATTVALEFLVDKGLKPFEGIGWETLGKAGVAITALGVAGKLIGSNFKDIALGALGLGLMDAALWGISKAVEPFAKMDWKVLKIAGAAIVGLGVIGGVAGAGPIPELIGMGAIALGLLGIALIPFAYAANLAAPALDKIADSLVKLKDMPVSVLLAVGPALAAIGAGLAVFSSGSLFSSIIDGIGSLFGAKSPFDKIIELGKAAPGIEKLTNALKELAAVKDFNILGNLDVDKTIKNINNINEALWNLLGTQKKVNSEISGTLTTTGDNNMQTLVSNTAEYNKFAKAALSEQIKRQDTMIELLVQLVRKPVGGGSGASFNSYNTPSPENYRTDYNNQTLLA